MATNIPYILARTLKEAHDFARDRGFERGHYRVVNSSGTIKSVRNADLYLVPGWENRYDRFAMKSAIRWCRMNIVDLEAKEPQEPTPAYGPPPVDSTIVDLFNTPVSAEEAAAFLMIAEGAPDAEADAAAVPDDLSPAGEQLAIPIPGENNPTVIAPEVAEVKKPGRRRSRCKDCGTLHYKGDACSTSESV